MDRVFATPLICHRCKIRYRVECQITFVHTSTILFDLFLVVDITIEHNIFTCIDLRTFTSSELTRLSSYITKD
jgi:hypothetical protein